jgi:cell division protein FtsW
VTRKFLQIDRPLLISTLLLLGLGLVMVFSASANMSEERFGSAYLFVRKQILWDILGLAALIYCMRTDYHRWQKLSLGLLVVAFVLLTAVLVIGPVVKGARRWIPLGFMNIQPSEVAKLAIIVWLSDYLDRHRSQIRDFQKGFLPPLVILGLLCVLILKEPDLGTPMLLGVTGIVLLFLSGADSVHIFSLMGASLLPLYYELFHVGYRYRRLMSFLDPWADASGTGYQLTQSLLAFGSGGLFGKGLGASQLKLLYLPDPHTDFIFPVIGEELGFVGAMAVVALFVFWGLRGWQVAKRAPDLFGQLLAAGITCWILLQAAINMSVSCGLFPTKGLPLPFVSFGGSSLIISLAAVGILLNISGRARVSHSPSARRQEKRARR